MRPDIDFRIGDFVLVAVPNRRNLTKLDATWRGPYKVINYIHTDVNERGDINNRVFELEHLVSKTKMEAHAMRIKFYSSQQLDQHTSIASLQSHISAQEAKSYDVEDIVSHKFDNDLLTIVLEIKWKGFTSEDNSFEPLFDIYSDTPLSVNKYLASLSSKERDRLKNEIKNFK